ncbi:hypothetical protein ACEQ8H_003495 [Pleosporales sp. CAS-2024a]
MSGIWPDARKSPYNANLRTVNLPQTLIGVTLTLLSLAVIAMSLRLWVRFRDRLWGWDDLFVLCAGLISVVGDTFVCLMPGGGLGLHLWTLNADQISFYFKHVYVTNLTYCSSTTCIKLAILFQYLRLFAETASSRATAQYRLARRVTISLIVISSAWGLSFTVLAIFPCTPIDKDWNVNKEGKCIGWGSKDPNVFFSMFAGHSTSNMVLDLLVLVTPIPFLGMLRMGGRSRAGLITLFIMGTMICCVSIGRLIALSINRAGTSPLIDMTYHTPVVYMFSVLEVHLAILAASIPIFWPVIISMATNKIWVVNEIEIRVESNACRNASFSTSGDIDLTDQGGKWSKLDDAKDDFDGKPPNNSRLSIIAKTYDHRDRSAAQTHRHKPSTTSLGRTIGFENAPRSSQDSTRNLCHHVSSGDETDRRMSQAQKTWFADMERQIAGDPILNMGKTNVPPKKD